MRAERLAPPRGGTAPAEQATLPDGRTVFLGPLAREATRRHWDEFPEEQERYGDAGFEWCAHDLQWVLWWAALEAAGSEGLLGNRLAWLAGILEARGYPVARLRRAVELAADVAGAEAPPLAPLLRAGAASLPG